MEFSVELLATLVWLLIAIALFGAAKWARGKHPLSFWQFTFSQWLLLVGVGTLAIWLIRIWYVKEVLGG